MAGAERQIEEKEAFGIVMERKVEAFIVVGIEVRTGGSTNGATPLSEGRDSEE